MEAKEYGSNKRSIKDIISEEIAEHKSNVEQIKGYIEIKFGKSLSAIDNAYIERKYVKFCARLWLQELIQFLKELTDSTSPTVIQEVFSLLDTIKDLGKVPHPCKQLEYYTLLVEHNKLICKEDERIIINQFKTKCLEQIVACSDSAEKELVFLETFIDFLGSYKNLGSIIAELELEDFCRGNLSYGKFRSNLLNLEVRNYGTNLRVLKETAKCLLQGNLFLMDMFKEVVSAYLKPVEIRERRIDDRLVVEVTGKNIAISETLHQLENKLSGNCNIKEVRFIASNIIHIDANLNNEVWHGKNIVILTKAIEVHDQVTWNVSGKDNNHVYSNNAVTGEDGYGKKGSDGFAGESAGNVLILAEKVKNPEYFTIISNGGKGSKGQDGGDGRDGNDGKGITKAEFDQKFPPTAKLVHISRVMNIYETVINIKEDLQIINSEWFMNKQVNSFLPYDKKFDEQVIGKVLKSCNQTIHPEWNSPLLANSFRGNIFINATTNQGNEIVFSFERGGTITNCQAFLLYKGSQGQPGGHGGEYGLGGQGGYAGDVIVRNQENRKEFKIVKHTKQGKDGEKGQGGLYGSHGKNGWDMGYMDYSISQFLTEKWPKYFGADENSKLALEFHNDISSTRVRCPYREYQGKKDIYTEMTSSSIEQKKERKYVERKNIRQSNDRQHHALAVRKKNISQSSILANYSHHFSSIEKSTLQNLQSELDNIKQVALQAVVENQKQQEKHTVEMGIKRQIISTCKSKIKYRNNTVTTMSSAPYTTSKQNVESLIVELKNCQQLPDNWFQLKDLVLSLSQLNQLFSSFEALKNKSTNAQGPHDNKENSKLQDIEKILINKYRLAALQEIEKQLPPYKHIVNNLELTPERAVRYLVKAQENNNSISHSVLGNLNQYFHELNKEQHYTIFKFCDEKLQGSDEHHDILKHCLKMFVLEVGESKQGLSYIKKYYYEHKEFLEKQERSLKIFLEAFQSELSRQRHEEVFELWIESIKDESLKSKLEEKLQKDDFLMSLYNRLNSQLVQDYDWNKCCSDKAILQGYKDYVREKGPLSESYRELLAYVFDVNIRVYVGDLVDQLSLQDNHNPSARKTVFVFLRANEFIQLEVDEKHFRLEEGRNKIDERYARILAKVEPFQQKQQFDDYLQEKAFLSINNLEYDKSNQYLYDVYCVSEEEDIRKIVEYFPEEEKLQLKTRLEKITSQYIGQQGILHNILKSFSSEGKHVTYQEMCCLITSILTSIVEDRKEQNKFCWMVAAYPQRNWMDELILLKLENYFKKTLSDKSKWKEYLSQITNKDILLLFNVKLSQCKSASSISTQCVEDILYLMSSIPNETISLEGIGLNEWPYALKEKYWLHRLSQLTNWQESEKLPTALYYLFSIENVFGTNLVKTFLKILEKKKQELSPDALTDLLSNFHNDKWSLCEAELKALDSCNISEWAHNMQQKVTDYENERDLPQLVELIKGNANTSKGISDNLPTIENSIRSICKEKYVVAGKYVGSFTEDDIKNWVEEFQSNLSERKLNILVVHTEMLALIDRAIQLKKEFKLRDTQRLTVLALLANDRSTLAQVSTGEGKSLIVVAASIMKALWGEKVDIITNSSVLAKRDAEVNRDIYSLFNINVSHNCNEDIEKRKEAYSGNQVVYGDLSNFQRDYLLDKFYGKNILGDRYFESVIVDEVDSMMLDKGNNMLYLSHDLAGLDKLEPVYIYIWQWINRPATDHEEQLSSFFDTKEIKEAVLNDLYGLIKKEDIGKLGSELSEQHENLIWERMIEAAILDGRGKLCKENINENELDEILAPEFNKYKDRLGYLLKECIEREKYIHIPNYLKPFVEQHLESWINSAITAFFMKSGQDYVVDIDRTGTSPDRNPNIRILDRDTGTDQLNSQWDEALHQFLQLKHGCKLSLQSLKAVFVSNVSFFKLYKHLYGLTGTLGSQRERDLLKAIYGVDFITIPTARSKQFHEAKTILCTSKKEWINHIHNEVKKLTESDLMKRSVLIICETVNDVETLHKDFGGKYAKHVHTYRRDYEEFDIDQGNKELEQGQIIIATNLAGRGTDIKITKGLRKAGGLHVCLTYLPMSIRIEQQAFGRAARSGDKGSGQLIVMDSEGQEYSNSKIMDLRKERDAEELRRISDIKAYWETQITMEENCFKIFKEQYGQLKKDLEDNGVPNKVKVILLQTCLDKWAFWLDENSKCIKDLTEGQDKINYNDLLKKCIPQLKNLDSKDSKNWLAWVDRHPTQMIKLGKYFAENLEYDYAILLFNKVIKQEPYFSEAAHYYKAFAMTKHIDWKQKTLKKEDKEVLKEVKKELHAAARLLDEHSKFSMNAAGIISKIKTNNNESIIQIDAYVEQQKSISKLYYMFSQSIDDILGHFVTPQSFVNYDIKEGLAEVLYEDLLRDGILKKPRVKKNISGEELKIVSSGYGISVKTLNDLLSRYRGKEIDENEFQKVLKKEIQLPSREAFWKSLIKQEVLSEEIKYIIVDNEKLREIDPLLLGFLTEEVDNKGLGKRTLESNSEHIFLYSERITQQQNADSVFVKNVFIQTVGKDKYQLLKKKAVLSFNSKARINPSKIKSTTFSCYDSVTLEDFTKVNITESEAETILAGLQQEVIEKKSDSENRAYGLKIQFNEIEHVQLSSCQVYENAVKALLSLCFTYRIALQKIEKQLAENSNLIHLQLITKPHQNLMWALIEQNIIKPVTVSTETKDLEEKLNGICSRTKITNYIKLMLSQSKLIPEEAIEKLSTNHPVVKQWIYPILNIGSIFGILTHSNSFDNKIDKRLQLFKEDTIKNIARTLERSRSSLQTLKVPDGKLKPLTEYCGQGEFGNIEEVHAFFLNGLDQLIQLEEEKWTLEMRLNTAKVVAMGVCQIAIGTAIELYSIGTMTHVGAAFVNEGVNDILFAAGALRSGYFSWKDYKQHKLESIIITAFSAGIGACLSKGAKVSRFGHKIAGPSFKVDGKVIEMSGARLINFIGRKVIVSKVVQRITLKTIEGIAFGLANAGVEALVENYLQSFCEGIASTILSDIGQEVEKHDISKSLKEIYNKLGEEQARKMVEYLTKNAFTKPSYINEFLYIANKITGSVIQGIAEATKKNIKTGSKLVLPIHTISKIVVWSERSLHVIDMIKITGTFLDNLNKEINSMVEKHTKRDSLDQKQEVYKDCERFKQEVISQWKSLIREKAGQVISQHIVSPILKEGANSLVRYVGKQMQNVYQSCKESGYYEQFKERTLEYQESLHNTGDDSPQIRNYIIEEYHKDLLKLLVKTKSPKLFAAIVREGVPMDLTCANASVRVIHKMLEVLGIRIPELIIIVQGEGGIRQKFSSVLEGVEGKSIFIALELKDNHFQLHGNSTDMSENNGNSVSKNNCLFEALTKSLCLNMTAEEFRAKVADCIEHDQDIQYTIRQGWHKLPLSLGAFGGRRGIANLNKLNQQAEVHSPYQHSTRGGWKFDGSKDMDLREVGTLSNEKLHLQHAKAFNEALNEINLKLSNLSKHNTPVGPGHFEATKYDTILSTGNFGKIGIALYPVEMRATVNVWIPDIKDKAIYTLKINFDNPVIEPGLQGPHGPHVGYDVIRHNKQAPVGVTGHILINQVENKSLPDRGRSRYSSDDIAILPRIPTTRIFYPPNQPNTFLERIDAESQAQIRKAARGRTFPSPHF